MKHCCVEDPSDLCSVNVSGENLTEVKGEDLALFDNVAYVNASENILPLGALLLLHTNYTLQNSAEKENEAYMLSSFQFAEGFKNFPAIRELELPLNAVRNVKLKQEDFPWLEVITICS